MKLSEYRDKLTEMIREHGDHNVVNDEGLDPDLPEYQDDLDGPEYVLPS